MKMSPMSEISSISSTSTTAQRRKIKKPLIEKRRRLRINQSLANLKSLVLEATKKDENCFPKMEKADILEMTVAYMKTMNMHRLPATSCPVSLDGDDQMRTYLSGFQECAMQVCSFLMDESTLSVGGVELCGQLSRHLSGCFHRMELDRRQNQGDDWRRRRAPSFRSSDPGVDSSSAKEKQLFSGDDQPYLSDLKSVSPPVTLTLLTPLSAALPTNFTIKTTTSQSQSTPQTFNSRSRFASDHHSTAPLLQTSAPLVQQHPGCVSPKKGDDFPMVNAIRPSSSSSSSSSMPVAVGISKSTLNPYDHIIHREVLPAADFNSSIVWRPW